jgi:uncharacterized protein with PQ loop repeat
MNITDTCFPTQQGHPYIPWIYKVFGDCIYTPLEQASFGIGLSSLGFWAISQIPQVITNCRRSDASSLSPFFLLIWAIGDSTNLLGAILTGQLATQIVTAIFFCLMSFVLILQWLYYTLKNKCFKKKKLDENQIELKEKMLVSVLLPVLFVTFLKSAKTEDEPIVFYARKLLQEVQFEPNYGWPLQGFKGIFGYTIGIISAILYLSCRLPQIVQNMRQGSTEGLSLFLFVCSLLGNFTYSLSIFLFSVHPRFLLAKLPWIVGSAGAMMLDLCILAQFLYFNIMKRRKMMREKNDKEASQYYVRQE